MPKKVKYIKKNKKVEIRQNTIKHMIKTFLQFVKIKYKKNNKNVEIHKNSLKML